MAFSLQNLWFVFFVSLFIFWTYTENGEAFSLGNNGCDELKSTVSALQSIIKEKNQVLLSKEEKIRELELLTEEKCKAEEHNSELENIDENWFLSKFGLNPNKTQAYIMTLWHQNLISIPSFKEICVTLSIYVEPKAQYVTDKSIELFYTSKQTLTPFLTNGFNVSYNYLEEFGVMIIQKAQVALEPYTENVRHGFKKLVNLWRMQ